MVIQPVQNNAVFNTNPRVTARQNDNDGDDGSLQGASAASEAKFSKAPPMGAGPKPVEAVESSSSSSQARIYDKRDANQDGTVSYQEAITYTYNQTQEASQEAAVTPNQVQTVLNAYQQNLSSGSTNSSRIFSI
ncbi:MAG: hypothetical protein WCP19_15285 [Chloroflexota bacterium]